MESLVTDVNLKRVLQAMPTTMNRSTATICRRYNRGLKNYSEVLGNIHAEAIKSGLSMITAEVGNDVAEFPSLRGWTEAALTGGQSWTFEVRAGDVEAFNTLLDQFLPPSDD